tara:strand:- start:5838 stop:6164 length:327 start_codon:yes stop_codon:yes gene_type:complete
MLYHFKTKPKKDMYYNTTQDTTDQQSHNLEGALTQNQRIIGFIRKYKLSSFTAYELQTLLKGFEGFDWLITSVRRAIHTLTSQGFLHDSGDRRIERYGKNNIVWRVTK